MNREQKYDAVNSCDNFKALGDVIEEFADDDGMIQGRTKKFDAGKMAVICRNFSSPGVIPAMLTREFGIRQQAMYISYYEY